MRNRVQSTKKIGLETSIMKPENGIDSLVDSASETWSLLDLDLQGLQVFSRLYTDFGFNTWGTFLGTREEDLFFKKHNKEDVVKNDFKLCTGYW